MFALNSLVSSSTYSDLRSQRSGDHRRRLERVMGHRGWQCPLQPIGTVPYSGRGRLTAAKAFDHRVQKQHLAQAEAERTDRCDHVEVRELKRVVGNAAGHAGETEKVHR